MTYPRAVIHLGNIASNWRVMGEHAAPGVAGAVVKADAYGHGAGPVSRALADAGCETFFVAYALEGAEVRRAIGAGPAIYSFNGEHDAASDVRPVINTLDALAHWTRTIGGPFAVHIDTAMHRLGIPMGQLGAVADLIDGHAPLVMTHLACADDPGSSVNAMQAAAIAQLRALAPGRLSVSNSAGHWLGEAFASDLSRPGIALYGGGNSPLRSNALKPGLTLEAQIIQVADVRAGETVGYGATFRAEQAITVATVGLGYGDGFLRSASNRGLGYLGDVGCPIIGRVSMDLITIDVSAVPGLAKPGAWVEFIGPRADLEAQAEEAGSLGYELLTGLGRRVERIYED